MVKISCGVFLHCPCWVLTRLSLSNSRVGMMMIYSTSHFCSSFTFCSKQIRVWFRMIAPAALHSSTQLTNLCIPMQSQHSNCVSQITRPHLMMGTFHPTYASWAWLIKSTIMLVHAHMLLFYAFLETLAWKWIWLTRCQSRDLHLLLASTLAKVILHLIRRAEALGHAHQATAPLCREVMAAATRLRHTGIMHVRIGMVVHTIPSKFAMPVNTPVILQQIAMFLQLHCSLRSISGTSPTT